MIGQVVAQLVVVDTGWQTLFPVQHVHATTSGCAENYLQPFTGSAVAAQLQSWQVTDLSQQAATAGLIVTDLAQATAVSVVDVAFTVVWRCFA
ncbi:hypothetical protein D3C81_1053490 [compost metagenome]